MVKAGNITGLLRDLINSRGKEFGIKGANAIDCDSLIVVDSDDMEHKITIDDVEI